LNGITGNESSPLEHAEDPPIQEETATDDAATDTCRERRRTDVFARDAHGKQLELILQRVDQVARLWLSGVMLLRWIGRSA
jgi:hypothetical protein